MRIYVTHIAGRVAPELFQQGVSRLREAGATVVYDERFIGGDHAYLAHADDRVRLADLQRALTMPGIDAIVCARGGYGTMRTLAAGERGEPLLFPEVLHRPICGFSDITALHLHLNARDIPSVHGPVVTSLALDPDPDAAVRLLQHLREPDREAWHELEWLVRPPSSRPIEGRLLGGNLALISACIHEYASRVAGSILLLEDVGESPYRLDRYLQTLRDATALAPPAAVVLGDFTRCADASGVLQDQLSAWGVPVAGGLRAGHDYPNLPLTLGMTWSLAEGEDGMAELTNGPHPCAMGIKRRRFVGSVAPTWTVEMDPDGPSPMPTARVHALLQNDLSSLADNLLTVPLGSAVAIRVYLRGRAIASVDAGTHWRAGARGSTGEGPATGPESSFDLASLTKPLATAILCHQAIEAGVVSLNTLAPESVVSGQATLADLLRHCSGLPAHERLFERTRALRAPGTIVPREERAFIASLYDRVRVDPNRVGRHTYSDLGYIALGRWLELLGDQTLDTLFATNIARPAGCTRLGFRRLSDLERIQPQAERAVVWTEHCPWRDAPLAGIVHDENAQELDGVAGHAGLFGTADDVGRLVCGLMGDRPDVLSAASRDRMWSTDWLAVSGSHTLGWDTPSGEQSTAGKGFTDGAVVGHLGFTGTSVWVDRATQTAVVALTNRVHGGRDVAGINAWRRTLHTKVWAYAASAGADLKIPAAD